MNVLKKIVILIIITLMIALDVWILTDFNKKIEKTGIIDKNEKIKVDLEYLSIGVVDLINNYEYMSAFKEDLFGNLKERIYIDLNGNEYDSSSPKNNWELKSDFYENRAATYSKSTGKEGYVDWNGNKKSQFIYDYTGYYENGYAKVGIYDNGELKYGVIDLNGNQVIPCSYDYIDMDDSEDDIFYVYESNDVFIVNNKNVKLAKYVADDKFVFINLNKLSELGVLDCDNVSFSKDYVFICGDNGKYGFFTINGEKVCDFKYDSFESISSQYLFLVEESGKRYIIDDNDRIVLNTEIFDKNGIEIYSIENGRIRIEKNNKCGIADLKGNIIIKPEYDNISIQTANSGYFSTQKDDMYGIMDLNGNEIIKCSDKYKQPILGNGKYFVVKQVNPKLLVLWIGVLIVTFIIEIILVVLFFKRKKTTIQKTTER